MEKILQESISERGDLNSVHKCLMRGKECKGAKFFQVVATDKTRGNGYKLKHMKFNLNKIKHFFTVRVVKDWNRFSERL